MNFFYKLLIFYIILFPRSLWAFNDQYTHPTITERAVSDPSFDTYLKEELGISEGINEVITEKTIIEWIKYGSEQEDHPMCRASNHFHNPSLPWNESGLSDPFFPYIVYCFLFSSYNHNAMISDLTWATGYLDNPDVPNTDITQKNEQDWESAREYFYFYLTGTDDTSRKKKLGECMQALGQVLHLLQDMAVPAHVRNDFSQGHQMLVPEYPLLGNRFESYVRNNSGNYWFNINPIGAPFSAPQLTDFWDTTFSAGDNTSGLLGLSEYTQLNFLSEFSIFSDDFPFPKNEHCVTYYDDSFSPPRKYFASTNGHPGERINHLAVESYLYSYDEKYIPGDWQSWPPPEPALVYFALDDKCYYEYASKLIPRAIGYSADLMDYFFRGKLEVTAEASSESFKLKIKNMTPTREELSGGQFSLTVRYTPEGGNSDGSDDIFVGANDVVESGVLQYDQEVEYQFDFSEPIPEENLDSAKYILAFKGKLGNEENAVIGKVQKVEGGFPCLVIELDGEFIIWDIKSEAVVEITDAGGSPVSYPINSTQLTYQLLKIGIAHIEDLSAVGDVRAATNDISLKSAIYGLHTNYVTHYDYNECCESGSGNCLWDRWFWYRTSRTSNGTGFDEGYSTSNPSGPDWWYCKHFMKKTEDVEIIRPVSVPGGDNFQTAGKYEFREDIISHNCPAGSPGCPTNTCEGCPVTTLYKQTQICSPTFDIILPITERKSAFIYSVQEKLQELYYRSQCGIIDSTDNTTTTSFYYRSSISDALDGKLLLGDTEIFGSLISDHCTFGGTHGKVAVVLEQPIVWNVTGHGEISQIHIQKNATLVDPGDPESGYVYSWNLLSPIDMSKIFTYFTKTLSEDVGVRGVSGGLRVSIYDYE